MASTSTEWAPPSGLPSYSCVPDAVLEHIWDHPTMVSSGRGRGLSGVPLYNWRHAELAVLAAAAQTGSLLAADAAASGAYVAASPVHGLGVFAARPIAEGEIIMPFYGQLVYSDLEAATPSGDAPADGHRYGPHSLPLGLRCTVREWKRNALELRVDREIWTASARHPPPSVVSPFIATKSCYCETPTASTDPVWVVPAPFCAAGLANDPRPEGDGNAIFVQDPLPVHTKEQLVLPWTAHVEVTEDIEVGEEILVGYGDEYAYFHA